MGLRLGSKVRYTGRYYVELYGKIGKIVPMPGGHGKTRNGTKSFKYVQFVRETIDGTPVDTVIGLFTNEIERV
jgi:hypothetical protein